MVLNARDAEKRGASIQTREKVIKADVIDGIWEIQTQSTITGETNKVTAKMIVNAAGPWVSDRLARHFKK